MRAHRLVEGYASFVVREPYAVLIACLAAALLGLVSAGRIRLDTDIANMLPADNAASRSYSRIDEAFSSTSTLVVLCEGPDRPSLVKAAEDLTGRIGSSAELAPLVRSIRLKVDPEFVRDWGLVLQDREEIRESIDMLASTNLLPLVTALNSRLEDSLGGEEAASEIDSSEDEDEAVGLMTRIELFAEELRAAAAGERAPEKAAAAMAESFLVGDGYSIDPEGRSLVFALSPAFALSERSSLVALVDGLRVLAEGAASANPGVSFSLTGDVAGEADEERALGLDSFYPSLLAFFLIFVLFFFSFARFRSVLFALVSLAFGILVDVGLVGLVLGKLNMITSSFGAILVGLGIDFAVHVCSRFDEVLGRGGSTTEAAREAIVSTILPVSMGALTTAAAFFALLSSRTPAFRQFGLVSGMGILTTLAAMFSLLPALLAAFGGRPGTALTRRRLIDFSPLPRLAAWSARHPYPVAGAAAALLVLALFSARFSRFQYDLRDIGPSGTAAQAAEAHLRDRFDLSSYVILAAGGSLEEVRALAKEAKAVPGVRRTESLADYIPSGPEQAERLAVLGGFADSPPRYAPFAWDAEACEALALEVERLEDNLVELGDLAAASLGEDCLVIRKRSAMIREIFGSERGASGAETLVRLAAALREPGAAARVGAADAAFAPALDALARRMAGPGRPIGEADLPEDALRDLRSADGSAYLLVAYPDRRIASEEALVRLSDSLAARSPAFTGSLQMGLELSRMAQDEALRSSLVVAAVVAIITFAGFRALAPAILSILGLGAGMALTFGAYPLVGSYNIINILSLPLIIGVGIDYGIHLVHRWRRGEGIRESMEGTGRAIVLSAATTMVGFGSLGLVGSYRGVASLGWLLFVGAASCLASALIFMPAILALADRAKASRRRRCDSPEKEVA